MRSLTSVSSSVPVVSSSCNKLCRHSRTGTGRSTTSCTGRTRKLQRCRFLHVSLWVVLFWTLGTPSCSLQTDPLRWFKLPRAVRKPRGTHFIYTVQQFSANRRWYSRHICSHTSLYRWCYTKMADCTGYSRVEERSCFRTYDRRSETQQSQQSDNYLTKDCFFRSVAETSPF